MNIHLNFSYNYSTSFFKENALQTLTDQQKKVLAIASLIFGILAVCYIVKRCCFKASVEENEQGGSISPIVAPIRVSPTVSIKREGELIDGMLNGKGKKIFPEGGIFEGEFKDDKLNGQGKITFANGTVMEGKFKDEKLNGQCKIIMPGGVIEGEFRDNKLNGQGKIKYANGDIQQGEFMDSKLIKLST